MEICMQSADELPMLFGNFTPRETWNIFYDRKGVDEFEWCSDWEELLSIFWKHLSTLPVQVISRPKPLKVLVPACGKSSLSEHLYAGMGYKDITSVDFSEVVISAMSRKNENERPLMTWIVMDMTNMQFKNETFDVIVDKGGLDYLMVYELAPRSGILYISEVKRLLKPGGFFMCITSSESHVLGQLFRKFRFGWTTALYSVATVESCRTTRQRTFMFVAKKSILTVLSHITPFMEGHKEQSSRYQPEALAKENTLRSEYLLEQRRVIGDNRMLQPGPAVKNFSGEPGKTVHQVTSALSGPILVEERVHFVLNHFIRRLSFGRTAIRVHSEVIFSKETSRAALVEHRILPDRFYRGVVSGLLQFNPFGALVKTMIIGLGSGLLPMFMRKFLPTLHIEVVELDQVVLNVAKEYFGFEEDGSLKVLIADATKFFREKANSRAEGIDSSNVDVVIIDVDSSDSSSGLISPDADFLEESFLLDLKAALSDNGILIFKLEASFPGVRAVEFSKLRRGTMPSSMKNPSSVPMWKGVKFSYLIIAFCLFPMAIVGYWAYGNLVSH